MKNRLTIFSMFLSTSLLLGLAGWLYAAQPGNSGTYTPFITPQPLQTKAQAIQTTPTPAPTQDDPRIPITPRQRDLLIARILSRQGYYADAFKLFRNLEKKYPGDTEIQGYYAETLITHQDYDQALQILNKILKQNPNDPLSQSLMARIYLEHENYRGAFPYYEAILERQPGDLGTMGDYASAARSAGDWQRALAMYQRILEAAPKNDDAFRAVEEITRERTSALSVGTRFYNQGGNSQTNSITASFETQLSSKVRLEIDQLWVDIRRLEQEFTPSIYEQLNMVTAKVRYEITPQLDVYAGLSPYTGYRDSFASTAGLNYTLRKLGELGLNGFLNMPWYDPTDAVLYGGNYDMLQATYSTALNGNWSINFAAELWDYRLEDQLYGEKKTFSAQITRRLPLLPGLSTSYGYYRSMFNYMDDQNNPVDMLENEAVHSLSLYWEQQFSKHLVLVLTGGLSQDEFKSRTNYFFAPSLRLRIGNRIELETGVEYQSDENTADGGESTAFTMDMRILF